MDVFTLNGKYKEGTIVNNIDNLIWTERYDRASDFVLVSEDIDTIRQQLPTHGFISHSDSLEVMIIESHEIVKKKGKPTTITVKGRSFETFLENRIARYNARGAFNRPSESLESYPNQYELPKRNSWSQAVMIIKQQIGNSLYTFNEADVLPNVFCYSNIVEDEPNKQSRIIEPGTVYERVTELLKVSNSGIKTMRPIGEHNLLDIVIHKGTNRSQSIIFAEDLGDLDDVSYYWSVKEDATAAFTLGKYDGKKYYPISPLLSGYALRWAFVNAQDIEDYSNPTKYDEQLVARAKEAYAKKKQRVITMAKISSDNKLVYNKDYFIGDVVGVVGDYDVDQEMRIIEFCWSLEGTKVDRYPTLSPLEVA